MTDEEEVVSPQEEAAEVVSDMLQDHGVEQQEVVEEAPREDHVPLSKFIKERKKRQELEQKYQQLAQARTSAEDTSMYESVTKQDLGQTQSEIIRIVEERAWIKNNPEKYERLQQSLEDFLEHKPHLAEAIKLSPNRWEEAYTLMDALTPKQQAQNQVRKETVKKVAPNAPTSVPKSAGISEAVDVMNMSDADYFSWRKSKQTRRR